MCQNATKCNADLALAFHVNGVFCKRKLLDLTLSSNYNRLDFLDFLIKYGRPNVSGESDIAYQEKVLGENEKVC